MGLFCDGLEEQIKARIYFYRNSQLVREGLIHVSDPPLLSRGNFLDSGVELDRRLLDYIVGLDTELNELVDGSVSESPAQSKTHNHILPFFLPGPLFPRHNPQ